MRAGHPKDSGVRDTVKGMVPGHVCIVQVCFTQGNQPARKTSTQAAALKAQPDADKTLNMILSRLDDMKAEVNGHHRPSWQIGISDYIVVTTGRVNRHVGAIAENVAKVSRRVESKAPTSKACPIAIGC